MIFRTIYKLLSSAKLAIVLLIAILACCVAGVTVFRGERAWSLIFNTLWFNAILVTLVFNVACCFFPRMWGRKLTLASTGMILFHLSFVAILGGIVYNSLFYFRGVIRLTEGEVLPSGDPASYDDFEAGRYFRFSKLKGETTLIRMHTGYRVGSEDKRAAYEIEVGERGSKKRGVIYITQSLDHKGFTYFNEKEGYSLLIMLYDGQGRELYGAHVPLQSLKQKDKSYLYTTGTKQGPGSFPFPQEPLQPFMDLQIGYKPSRLKERGGEAFFQVWRRGEETVPGQREKPLAEGKAAMGERFKTGDHYLEAKEVRYWVGMRVRYEPGKPIVLTSLWVGLGGVVLTFIGRLRKRKK
jgi:cytochrome c biogenesis protein ResB